ncbi:hypothetical protein CHS0354_023826 [Potamilus streckersoni]|uniref:Glucose-1-phosphate thymidylyltransferase n=1 Tax=Potamilus streckersoni TaxID=2493646 RepID=A0AAE0VMH8_9BIVA|nr:hypothetical protein CHS0354_023826 [Potamilus streckersoni]
MNKERKIVLFEDEKIDFFRPFIDLKPFVLLFCGAETLLDKAQEKLTQETAILHTRPYLQKILSAKTNLAVNQFNPHEEYFFLNSRAIVPQNVALSDFTSQPYGSVIQSKYNILGFVSKPDDIFNSNIPDAINSFTILNKFSNVTILQGDFQWINFPWDILAFHPQEMGKYLTKKSKSLSNLLISPNVFVSKTAKIGTGAILDGERGTLFISDYAQIQPGAILSGNIFIGTHAQINMGAKINSDVFIGNYSKIGGEIKNAIVEPYANKWHDGFLGDSYLSSWCNLGAGTTTSNMKNNYGTIKLHILKYVLNSNQHFLGTFFGDHSKSAINTSFYAGTMVGVCSMIFGNTIPNKLINSFDWGGINKEIFAIKQAVATVKSVMARRNELMTPDYEDALLHIFNNIIPAKP